MKGPEEKYEDNCIWKQERLEEDEDRPSKEDIYLLKCDEKYESDR